jgi:PIN domain nuclease of toxin-antitoxin system
MRVVLDTSAIIWWTLDQTRLTTSAHAAISNADELLISSVSVWEIGMADQKGRLILPVPFTEYVEDLLGLERLSVCPVDVETWVANLQLSWDHKDPADRTIVATAKERDLPLVTSDRRIRDFYPGAIW